jgi:hypothetical protein
MRKSLMLVAVLGVFVLIFAAPLFAAEQTVTLTAVKGVVEIIPQGATQGSAGIVGSKLKEGDMIKTYDRSRAEVTFGGVGTITVHASSQLVIQKAQVNGDVSETITNLKVGEIQAKVNKLVNASSKFETITPVAVAAVRGTTYRVTVTRDGTTTVYLVDGELELRSLLQDLGITLEPGQGAEVILTGEIIPGVTVEALDEDPDDVEEDMQDDIYDPTDVTENTIEGDPENPSPSE